MSITALWEPTRYLSHTRHLFSAPFGARFGTATTRTAAPETAGLVDKGCYAVQDLDEFLHNLYCRLNAVAIAHKNPQAPISPR